MNTNCKFEVSTKYGRFRFDEREYRDYLDGKTWFSPFPEKPTVHTRPTLANVSESALNYYRRAENEGAYSVCRELFPNGVVEVPYDARMCGRRVDEMDLSVRSYHGLMRAGVDTLGALRSLLENRNGLRGIRNLGVKSEREIKLAFFELCYALLSEPEKQLWWQRTEENNRSEQKKIKCETTYEAFFI